MTVTIDLKPEIEDAIRAAAHERGISIEDYLLISLENMMAVPQFPTAQEIAEFEADLDALVNGTEKAAPQPNEMFRRVHIYGED